MAVPDSPDGGLSFKGLFLLTLRDQEPWRECRARHKQLVQMVQYREQVQHDIRNLGQSSKSWWEFWK